MANPKSTASITGHPLHPMLVEFPIAFFVATFVSDLIFWRTGNSFWATASLWLLGAGLIMAALGWKGWKLVYLHRVGISDEHREREVASREAAASRR